MTANPRLPFGSPPSADPADPGEVQLATNPPKVEADLGNTGKRAARGARWLQRFAISLFVLLCAVLGVWLVLLPWSLQWTDNPLLWTHPDLRAFLGYGFVRGICSGLGVLDLWIGIREAARFTERLGNHR